MHTGNALRIKNTYACSCVCMLLYLHSRVRQTSLYFQCISALGDSAISSEIINAFFLRIMPLEKKAFWHSILGMGQNTGIGINVLILFQNSTLFIGP